MPTIVTSTVVAMAIAIVAAAVYGLGIGPDCAWYSMCING